jgi:DNA-binding FrmR family transcriptional regulator
MTCPCHKTKHRTEEESKALQNRLARIEGQVRGIRGMVESDAYCVDILTQVTAVTAALNAFSRELLAEHIRTCVTHDLKEGNEETVEELVETVRKMMR